MWGEEGKDLKLDIGGMVCVGLGCRAGRGCRKDIGGSWWFGKVLERVVCSAGGCGSSSGVWDVVVEVGREEDLELDICELV